MSAKALSCALLSACRDCFAILTVATKNSRRGTSMHRYVTPNSAKDRVISRTGKLLNHDTIDPKRTALIVVDMQNYLCAERFARGGTPRRGAPPSARSTPALPELMFVLSDWSHLPSFSRAELAQHPDRSPSFACCADSHCFPARSFTTLDAFQ
jgi:hypothetical protein